MENKKEQYSILIEKLFTDWKKDEIFLSNFYADGIVNETIWFENDKFPKILYILKEVHETGKNRECNFVKDTDMDVQNGYDKGLFMWRKIAAHARCILEKDYKFNADEMTNSGTYLKAVNQIAIINLKKASGGNDANSQKSMESMSYQWHTEKYSEFIQRQIAIISPSIIICCGTFEDCKKHIFMTNDNLADYDFYFEESPKAYERFNVFELNNGCLVFDNDHPSRWLRNIKEDKFVAPLINSI